MNNPEHFDLGKFDGMSAIQDERDQLKVELAAERARLAEREQALKFARTTLAVIATSQHLSAVERRSAQSEVNRIDALMCAAPPNITPSSEHKVPVGITHISRSLGRAIVRFKTSEQLNDFYRAAKASIPSPQ